MLGCAACKVCFMNISDKCKWNVSIFYVVNGATKMPHLNINININITAAPKFKRTLCGLFVEAKQILWFYSLESIAFSWDIEWMWAAVCVCIDGSWVDAWHRMIAILYHRTCVAFRWLNQMWNSMRLNVGTPNRCRSFYIDHEFNTRWSESD